MEKLHCAQQSHGRLARLISLAVLPPRGSFSRLVADWLGLRRRAPLSPEEDFPIENLPFPFDVDYQDSTTFHPDRESHLDWEFEPRDSAFGDPEPAINFWDSIFDDSNSIGEPHAECVGRLNKDIVLEDHELVTAMFTSSLLPRLTRETLRFVAIGSMAHLAALSLFIAAPTPSLPGSGWICGKPISVRLKETCEINTSDDPSPASVDSPASMAALARRDPKPEERRIRKQTAKDLPAEVEPKEVTGETKTEPGLAHAKSAIESAVAHRRAPLERSLDGHPNDSKSLQDSIASMPSVASPERETPSKSGDQAQIYKDLILSAIHEAAYYPRTALRHMVHGQSLVCFTINKDGSLTSVSIAHHADSNILDDAALKIVEKASSRFPPIPDSVMKEQVTYVVPIVFKKRR